MGKVVIILTLVSVAVTALAQTPTATLSGKVTDQTGAVITQATVTDYGAGRKDIILCHDKPGGIV